jgi:hypothetical protein
MELFIVVLYALMVAMALGLLNYRQAKRKKEAVYVCNSCNENHCECTQE